MFDSFIIGALSSLVIGAFYFLFKKPSKKMHLYIQNTVLIILGVFCLISFIAALATMRESPILILPFIIVVGPGTFFIVKKFLNNLKILKSNEFDK